MNAYIRQGLLLGQRWVDAAELDTLELRTRDRERKLIRKIDEALVSLDASEYGYCEACGIEIGHTDGSSTTEPLQSNYRVGPRVRVHSSAKPKRTQP